MDNEMIGRNAFIIGVVIALLAGLASGIGQTRALGGIAGWMPIVLVILGIIVGFLNISDKEVDKFLVASIALLVVSNAGTGLGLIDQAIAPLGAILVAIVANVAVFVAPAALIVGLKAIHKHASLTA